jgi:hypothetical protein
MRAHKYMLDCADEVTLNLGFFFCEKQHTLKYFVLYMKLPI